MYRKLMLILAAVSALLLPSPVRAAKSSASEVVNAVSNAIAKAGALEAKFTIRRQGEQPVSGTAFLQGKKFTLSIPEMRAWFDGRTQWTYSKSANEVDITEPTPEELAETNPVTLLVSNAKNCKARRLDAAAGTDRIELTPVAKGAFRKAVVTSDSSTNFLREIVVTMDDGTVATIVFTSMKKAAKKPDSYFRFTKKLIPSAQVVDLR